MLTFTEIERYKENNRLEAKRATGGFPHSLWETYSAFANTLGGIILLGVEERPDHTFQPVQRPNPQRLVDTFWQQVNDKKLVSCNILELEQVQIVKVQGYQIVMIEVPRALGQQRPVSIGTDVYQGTYQRNGEGDYRCSREEVTQMLQKRAQPTFDRDILQQITVQDLDGESVQQYTQLLAARHPWWQCTDISAWLQQAGAIVQGADGLLHPTRAGLLLLGRQEQIQENFPGYFLEYREKTKTGWQQVQSTEDGTWNGNLLQFYFTASEKLFAYVDTLALPAAQREAVYASVQEGLANGLMHANYANQRGIVVSRRRRTVWISNPGNMPVAESASTKAGMPSPRNELLVQLFHYMGVGHGIGSGLSGIAAVWQKQGWVKPRLEQNRMQGNMVLTLIFSSDDDTTVQEMQQEILLDYITTHITVSCAEAAKVLQMSHAAADDLLQQLLAQNILEREAQRYILKR